MPTNRVSVVIVARNEAKNIEKCLGGILSQQGDWSLDVVLIDSSSEDETVKLARQFPVKIHVIPAKDFHHGRTRNLGASMTHGEHIVFLQGDAWPSNRSWLMELINPLSESADTAAAYGRQLPKTECDPINRFRTAWNYGPTRQEKSLALEPVLSHRLYFFSTANCVIRRRIWDRFRFPEDVPIFEDMTFAHRVLHGGYSIVYNPRAEVIHSHNLGARQIHKRYLDAGYVQAKYAFQSRQMARYRSEGIRYLSAGVRHMLRESYPLWAIKFIWHTALGYHGLKKGARAFAQETKSAGRLSKRK